MEPRGPRFGCVKIGGSAPVYKIHDGHTGAWSEKTYAMEEGLKQGIEDAEKLNRLWEQEVRGNAGFSTG